MMKKGWEYKKLNEVCYPKNSIERASKVFASTDNVQYIDISSINNSAQRITELTPYIMNEAPSRAQQRVIYGDIIISTVRPNLKNVAIIDRTDDNLVASSGFCVLRSNNEIEKQYLFYFVTSDLFTDHLIKMTTGANYPAVKDQDVRDSLIPVPSLSTQQTIVAELDKINDFIRLKKEQLADLDNLSQSIFYEMFGDPVVNEKGWEVKRLGDLGKVFTGNTPSRSNPSYYHENYIEWVKTDNIVDDLQFPTPAVEYLSYEGFKVGRKVKKGSILVACIAGSMSSIGKCCITDREVAFNQQINAIEPNGNIVDCTFLYCLIHNSKKYIQESATNGMKHILNKSNLEDILFPLPPLPLQQTFATRIQQLEAMKAQVTSTIKDLETLLASRMQYWFDE